MIRTVISFQPYEQTIELLKTKYNTLSEDGSFFAIFSTEYDSMGNVIHDFFQIIQKGVSMGYDYVNTIIYPTLDLQNVTFPDNIRYVVWLCKNNTEMYLNKDNIREKHIWKDVEWGKRAKNYNPKGKDPGNVWIPTNDDGHANITEHILLSDKNIIDRIISMTDSFEDNEIFYNPLVQKNIVQNKYSESNIRNESKPSAKVIFDTSEKMNYVKDNSINVVITSPPYWNLKDYFKEGQIGQEPYNQYLSRMKSVWSECYRVLNPDGSLWININIRKHNHKVILIPYDFIKMCKELGFYYKGIFIWHKSSGIPTGKKNIVDRHEYVLVFSKKENFVLNKNFLSAITDYKNNLINGGAFWNINKKAGSIGKKYIHPAIYPNDLVCRIINMTTQKNDFVLDPFLGSGTSLIASLQCGRNFIGYEYNEGFQELMQSRFEKELTNSDKSIEFINNF